MFVLCESACDMACESACESGKCPCSCVQRNDGSGLNHMVSRDTLLESEVWTGGRCGRGVDGRVVVWASRRRRASRTSKMRACEAHGVALHLTRMHR